MRLFISQSQARSLRLAKALETFLRRVIQGVQPWVSDGGIDKGARFMSEIRDSLNTSAAGVVCITRENRESRWIHYEAGALSVKAIDRLWTVLLDVEHEEIQPPLSAFNHSKANRADLWEMVHAIHAAVDKVGDTTCTKDDLASHFEKNWTELEGEIKALQSEASQAPPTLTAEQETLTLVRQLVQTAGESGWRTQKALSLIQQLYEWNVARPAPTFDELRRIARGETALERLSARGALDGSGLDTLRDLFRRVQTFETPLPMPPGDPPPNDPD
jgi:hypothetical protein